MSLRQSISPHITTSKSVTFIILVSLLFSLYLISISLSLSLSILRTQNRDYTADQVVDVTSKLAKIDADRCTRDVRAQLTSSSTSFSQPPGIAGGSSSSSSGGVATPASSGKKKDSELAKVNRDCAKLGVEQMLGLMTEVVKERLFTSASLSQ